MSEYFKNIDPSYDNTLDDIAGLTWWPWVGRSYRKTDTKTFVLGESHYSSSPDPDAVAKIGNKKAFTREIHQTHAMGLANGKKTRYVRNIERALFQTKRPSVESVNAFWSSVIYHNLVLTPMPTKKHRPAYDHYFDGWEVFIKLAELLKPAQCIVYGLERLKLTSLKEVCISHGNSPLFERLPNRVGRSCPRRVTLSLNYGTLKMLFIRHPSQYFSWQTWGEILEKEIHLPAVAESQLGQTTNTR